MYSCPERATAGPWSRFFSVGPILEVRMPPPTMSGIGGATRPAFCRPGRHTIRVQCQVPWSGWVTSTRIGYTVVFRYLLLAMQVLQPMISEARPPPRPAPPLRSDVKEQICPISKLEISPEPVVPGRKIRIKAECTATDVTTNGKMSVPLFVCLFVCRHRDSARTDPVSRRNPPSRRQSPPPLIASRTD